MTVRAVLPADLADNGFTNDMTSYYLSSPMARLALTTNARRLWVKFHSNIYGSYAAWAHVGIWQGSSYEVLAATNNTDNALAVDLPEGTKTVEIVAGLQSKPGGTVLGSYIKTIYLSGGTTTTIIAPAAPSSRVLFYGDSITVGANATYPTHQGYPMLVRQAGQSVMVDGWGWKTLHDDASTEAARITFAARLAGYFTGVTTQRIWFAVGTNDYGLNKWTAAAFGAAYADVLDRLHAALPAATIYCQTPLLRSSEGANASGSTTGDYRTAISDAVSTRGPWAVLVDGTAILLLADLADGVHPTTAGHAKYAAEVKTVLGIP